MLLLLLLLLQLALLHFLHDLLRRANRTLRRNRLNGRLVYRGGRRRLVDFVVGRVFFAILLIRPVGNCRRSAGATRTEDDMTRRALTQIACKHHVVTRTLQKLRQDILGLSRAIGAIDSLVLAHPFHLRPGNRSHVVQDLLQAGICGIDA